MHNAREVDVSAKFTGEDQYGRKLARLGTAGQLVLLGRNSPSNLGELVPIRTLMLDDSKQLLQFDRQA